jgi:hypothetical protein
MPNRIIRDSARTSKTLAELSDFGERGFWRLVLAADDFGRFAAEPDLVLAACFPRMMEKVSLSMCEQMLRECEAAGLIALYEVDGARFGQFVKASKYFTRRSKHSKYPSATQTRSTCVAYAPEVSRFRGVEDRGSRIEVSRVEVEQTPVDFQSALERLKAKHDKIAGPSTPKASS